MAFNVGKRIAPPRFILFCVVLLAAVPAGIAFLGLSHGVMAGFDVASTVFLLSLVPLLRDGEAAKMRKAAAANDANRPLLLGLTGLTMVVILVAVFKELQAKSDAAAIALVIVTLALAWLFSNIIYALHYAHMFYSDCDGDGKDEGGIDFCDCKEPDYWDFIYFGFTIGMTFQTSDTQISSRKVRKIVTGHSLAAFVFNLGVLAFTINVLGGG